MISDAEVRRVYEESFKKQGGGAKCISGLSKWLFVGATEAQREELKRKAETIILEVKNGASFPDISAKYSLPEADVGFVP